MLGVINTQSARNKVDRIHDVMIEYDVDILTLTETWHTSAEKDDFFVKSLAVSGYKLYSVTRKGNKGYGGVAILYKSNLKVNARSSVNNNLFYYFIPITPIISMSGIVLHYCQSAFEQFWKMRYTKVNLLLLLVIPNTTITIALCWLHTLLARQEKVH